MRSVMGSRGSLSAEGLSSSMIGTGEIMKLTEIFTETKGSQKQPPPCWKAREMQSSTK